MPKITRTVTKVTDTSTTFDCRHDVAREPDHVVSTEAVCLTCTTLAGTPTCTFSFGLDGEAVTDQWVNGKLLRRLM